MHPTATRRSPCSNADITAGTAARSSAHNILHTCFPSTKTVVSTAVGIVHESAIPATKNTKSFAPLPNPQEHLRVAVAIRRSNLLLQSRVRCDHRQGEQWAVWRRELEVMSAASHETGLGVHFKRYYLLSFVVSSLWKLGFRRLVAILSLIIMIPTHVRTIPNGFHVLYVTFNLCLILFLI